MNGHSHLGAGLYRRNGIGSKLILSVFANIDITSQLRPSTFVHKIGGNLSITDDGGVLLAWTDSGAISGKGGVDWARSVSSQRHA